MSESPEKREGGSASEDRAACPECGAENSMDAETCHDCGYELHARSTGPVEVRYAVAPITQVDVRDSTANGDNSWTMSGYAAVFNQKTTLYNGKFLRLTESIAPQAFDRVLRTQSMDEPSGVVHFNFGHDMNTAVAATDVAPGQVGSLMLSADKNGLRFLARVSRDDPDAVKMAAKMRSGVLRQASFAFTIDSSEIKVTENESGPDEEHRTITRIGQLYDVCATPQGAYPQTVSQLRSIAAAIGQVPTVDAFTYTTSTTGSATTVNPDLGGGSVVSSEEGDVAAQAAERLEQFRRFTAEQRELRRTRFPRRDT